MRTITVYLICLFVFIVLSYAFRLKGTSAQNLPVISYAVQSEMQSLYLADEDLHNLAPLTLLIFSPIFSLYSSHTNLIGIKQLLPRAYATVSMALPQKATGLPLVPLSELCSIVTLPERPSSSSCLRHALSLFRLFFFFRVDHTLTY